MHHTDRCLSKGYIFASADYRLLPPTDGHQVLEDVKDAFAFVSTFSHDREEGKGNLTVDSTRIAVAGTSAGGLCAYLAAIHCKTPKPVAILSMYGMGGNFFVSERKFTPAILIFFQTPHYLVPKKVPFFRNRDLLDPTEFAEFLYPESAKLPIISGSPLVYHDSSYRIPGYPANPRMLLARLYLQLGTFLDYWTGLYEPSITNTLRPLCEDGSPDDEMDFEDLIPEDSKPLFPQLHARTTAWPPTLLVHGTKDTAVPLAESAHMLSKLSSAGALVRLIEVQGMEHSFDYEPSAEEKCTGVFDEVIQFLAGRMGAAGLYN